MSWPTDVVARRPGTIVVFCVTLWVLAAVAASNLELRVDLTSLLPEKSPAARAYREYLQRFHGEDRVFVIVTGGRESEIIDAAAFLAHHLALSPEVSSARAGLDDEDEKAFLQDVVRRVPLLLNGDDWKQRLSARLNPDSIRRRVKIIRSSIISPIPSVTKELDRYDPLGFFRLSLVNSLDAKALPIDPLSMAFVSKDSRSALVLVQTRAGELDAEAGRRLQSAIDEGAALLNQKFGRGFKVLAVGGPLYAAHDEQIIRSDLQRTLSSTAAACALIIVLVFGSPAIPLAGLAALCAGLTWLAAGLALTTGGVSAVALGFAAILVGLGIDGVIHGGMAFAALRHRGNSPKIALDGTFRSVSRPILTAAVTTSGAFAVLLVSRLPPLRELGAMVAAGMITLVLATGSLGAALTLLLSRKARPPGTIWRLLEGTVDRIAGLSGRYPRTVLLVTAGVTAIMVFPATGIQLEANLQGLRPIDHPAFRAERLLATSFGVSEDTLTILVRGENLDDALGLAGRIKQVLKEVDGGLTIMSPSDRLAGPKAIQKRLVELRSMSFDEAVRTLQAQLQEAGLDPRAFAPGLQALEDFARGADPGPVGMLDDEQLSFDPNGAVWASVTVEVPKGFWSGSAAARLQTAVESVAPNAMVASVPLLGADLRQTAAEDLRRLSVLSLLLIAALVLSSFRGKIGLTIAALTPVAVGSIWTLGMWSAQGRSLDLVGLAVLPVLLGLGIDDGLYAVHGAGARGIAGLGESVRYAGSAMVLTTLTTCLGFSSLVMSHLPSLKDAGILISIGVAACLAATLTILPAMAALAGDRTDG